MRKEKIAHMPLLANIDIKGMEKDAGSRFVLKPDFRERLLARGPESLSDEQLIAVLLHTGTPKKTVATLATEVMDALDTSNTYTAKEQLKKISGIGEGKLCTILAALELGRRFFCLQGSKISNPSELIPFLLHYAVRRQETFLCVSLSGAHEILGIRVVSVGTINRTIVHPREVFADPITDRAAAIIVAHNHPSGKLIPSEEDITLTKRLIEVGELLGIPVLDHLILSATGDFVSLFDSI